jgi:hypothetical protein
MRRQMGVRVKIMDAGHTGSLFLVEILSPSKERRNANQETPERLLSTVVPKIEVSVVR